MEAKLPYPLIPGTPTHRLLIGVPAGVRPSSLLLGQGGDEFAAEGGDVSDHAAPDRVARGAQISLIHSRGLLGRPRIAPHSRLVCSRV